MHRFFVDSKESQQNLLTLSERESYHAHTVLRVLVGERVVVLDGAGTEILGEVQDSDRKAMTIRVLQRTSIPPLPYQLTLIQAVPKGKMMDTIVQKAAELGAARVVPLLSERTIAQLEDESAAHKRDKWTHIAIDACKQCGSAWLPHIDLPITPQAFLGLGEKADLSLLATLQPDAKHPRQFFKEFVSERGFKPKSMAVWVGPEGDFTPAEINAIRTSGALPITLGPLVLRSETAACYCLSVLNYEWQAPA